MSWEYDFSLSDRELILLSSQKHFCRASELRKPMLQRKKSVIVITQVFRIASGGGRERPSAKAAVAMKRFSGRIVGSLFAGWALFFALPHAAHAIGMIPISDSSLCIDSMPDPDSDELQPILAAADGGCTVMQPELPISI
jgi:hypothetical protein